MYREGVVMSNSDSVSSLDEVRANIDRIDREIVRLMAERSGYVRQAARFKSSTSDVEAPARVESIIARVRGIAEREGLSPDIAEAVYRTMIDCFIDQEKQDFDAKTDPPV
jgi:isochorismate pyruvate lyase